VLRQRALFTYQGGHSCARERDDGVRGRRLCKNVSAGKAGQASPVFIDMHVEFLNAC